MNDSLGPSSREPRWSEELFRYQAALRRLQVIDPYFEDDLLDPQQTPATILSHKAALLEAHLQYRDVGERVTAEVDAAVVQLAEGEAALCLLGIDCPNCSGLGTRCGHLLGTWYVVGLG